MHRALRASALSLVGALGCFVAAPCTPPASATTASAVAASASGGPRVSLSMRFRPDRPGRSTTIYWGFAISEPMALRSLSLRLPAGMGFAASSLGLEACDPAHLAQHGPEGCPADSHLGFGRALAEVRAETTVDEPARVTAVMGPEDGEEMTVLFFVEGRWPVNREVILTSHLIDVADPHGATLLTEVPTLPVWPAGPNIGLIRFHSTIGPDRLTYYRRADGHTIAFKPRGLTVPTHCPRGGFRVSATFSWWTSNPRATATTRVPCPAARRR
jgi:hypothetical protein